MNWKWNLKVKFSQVSLNKSGSYKKVDKNRHKDITPSGLYASGTDLIRLFRFSLR